MVTFTLNSWFKCGYVNKTNKGLSGGFGAQKGSHDLRAGTLPDEHFFARTILSYRHVHTCNLNLKMSSGETEHGKINFLKCAGKAPIHGPQ